MVTDFATLPAWFTHSASVFTGLVFGSFANVLVARLPHRQSIVTPASRCPACGTPVLKRHNIPLLGYAMLGGKCRGCRAPISPRYPIIELLGGLLFLAAELRYGFGLRLIARDWPLLVSLLAITFIDLEHRIIPDVLSLGGLAWALSTGWLPEELSWLQCLAGGALGFSIFYALAWLYGAIAKRQGLGGGDIKLLAMLGAFLGPLGVLTTIVVSSLLGSVIGIGWGLVRRDRDLMGLSIPYGPFLVIGGLYYYFFGEWTWLRFTIPT